MDFYQRKGSAGDSSWQNSVKVADRMRASRDPTEPLPKRLVEYKENEAHQRRIDAEISSGSYESKNQAASPISNVTTGKGLLHLMSLFIDDNNETPANFRR